MGNAVSALGYQINGVLNLQGERASNAGDNPEDDENQPLDLSWPDSCRERITYILFLPIIIPLWLTLPDTRKASGIQ